MVKMQQEREQFQSQIAALQAENELLNETQQHQEKTTQELEEQNRQLQQQNQQLQEDNQELQQQLDNIVVPAVPDYEAVRDRILKNWRVAKSPEKRERIGEALNRYIEAIKRE